MVRKTAGGVRCGGSRPTGPPAHLGRAGQKAHAAHTDFPQTLVQQFCQNKPAAVGSGRMGSPRSMNVLYLKKEPHMPIICDFAVPLTEAL